MELVTNKELKAEARRILEQIEIEGANWQGVALRIACLYLMIDKMSGVVGVDLGDWDGSFCADSEDLEEVGA